MVFKSSIKIVLLHHLSILSSLTVTRFNIRMSDTYKTITTPAEGIYKEKGSKFLAFAIPVNTVDEVKEVVKNYRKEYYDARHVCYAYMLGAERKDFRANDDGEPSGTAGRPILGQINSRELTNVLVIVVRYFGGILLGTGGLVVAYKEATADALDHAKVIEKTVDETISINFDYILMNDVMRVIKDTNAQILHQIFDNNCSMLLNIRKQDSELVMSKLKKIIGVSFTD
ncbi:MAG TPA: YigZ family protein [Paludibacter sp.]|nr:YigZ family protein [Paludibacter sp.]